MSTASTHVLDAALGRPAVGIHLRLLRDGVVVESAETDADGRVRFATDLPAGRHTLVLDTGSWFAAAARDTFYPEVTLTFDVDPAQPHHHVALLLSPYAYTTYRGS